MSVWNVFDQDAFSLQSLTARLNQLPYTPGQIGRLGIFEEAGIATTTALIEEVNGVLGLVSVAPRGGVRQVVNDDKRKMYPFAVPHMPQTATIMADSVQGVRQFGSESIAKTIENARDSRLVKMKRQIDYTIEWHRCQALMGNYIDVNGTATSLYTTFGVSQDTVDFALNSTSTKVRSKCLTVIGHVEDGLGGVPYERIHALCGATFWQDLITHVSVEQTYLNTQMAAALREGLINTLDFGDIRFERYRGNSAALIPVKEAYAFPVGVPEMFLTRFAPANYLETVNTEGLPYYAKAMVLDFDKGLELEAQSNPLNLVARPAAVVKLTTP